MIIYQFSILKTSILRMRSGEVVEKIFDSTKKKDKFLKDTLLTYLLKAVEEEKNNGVNGTAHKTVAEMSVFPYRKGNVTMLGSLTDNGINWYYKSASQNSSNLKEYDNFRIIDEAFLGDANTALLKKVYPKEIKEFSAECIIDDLISKMSVCTGFDETWWSCCRDLYDILKEKGIYPRSTFSEATKSIEPNNCFIFDETYCPSNIKNALIKNEVFSDIFSTEYCEEYFKKNEMKNLAELLVYLGVPNGFTSNNKYNLNLKIIFTKIYDETYYPVDSSNEELYELSKLSEYVVLKVFNESTIAFKEMYNDEDCRKGMMIKNLNGDYISLSNSLFIMDNTTYNNQSDDYTDSDYIREYDSSFDFLLIDDSLENSRFIEHVPSIFKLSTPYNWDYNCISIDNLNDYDFTFESQELNIHKWLWQYNRSQSFADWILSYYHSECFTSDDGYACFALEAIDIASIDCEIDINIELSLDDAFKLSEIINRIQRKKFESSDLAIYLCQQDFVNTKKYDCLNIQSQIIADIDPSVSGSFYNDAFWNTIRTVNVSFLIEQENYVILQDEYDSNKTIILIPGSDEFTVKRCIKKYIHEQHDVSVNRMDEGLIDWAKEYQKLKEGLLGFITSKSERGTIDVISDKTIDIRDINSFAEEKRLWDNIRETRKKVMRANSRFDKVPFGPGKEYLRDKYKGYCQLCGVRTPKQSFYQFHIVEPHEFGYEDSFKDLEVNLLCTCPSCWGILKYGYGKYDLRSISRAAKRYVQFFLENEDGFEEGEPIISELFDEDEGYCIQDMIHPGDNQEYVIRNPIVFRVVVNGEEREMFFAWEHFLRIAILLNEDIIYDEED